MAYRTRPWRSGLGLRFRRFLPPFRRHEMLDHQSLYHWLKPLLQLGDESHVEAVPQRSLKPVAREGGGGVGEGAAERA